MKTLLFFCILLALAAGFLGGLFVAFFLVGINDTSGGDDAFVDEENNQ